MATIQRSTTKVASKLLSYAEKRATERSGVDCPPEYAKAQFKATRELWGKTEGIQAHHIIQSFKPGEVTPVLANEIGKELAKELAPGHEVVIYTHTDKDHIHNHIVINAVSFETGAKYHAHGKEELFKIREVSDRLCSERGLSVIQEPSAEQRYHRAEYGLAKRGLSSWKDELRQSIDLLKKESNNINELADKLKKDFGIETKITPKNISFKHPDNQKFVRGSKLGLAYEKETLSSGFERETSVERTRNTINYESIRRETNGISGSNREIERIERIARVAESREELYGSSNGQRNHDKNEHAKRTGEHGANESDHSRANAFDLNAARRNLEKIQRSTTQHFKEWQDRNNGKQQSNDSTIKRDSINPKQSFDQTQNQHTNRNSENEREHSKELKRTRSKQQSHDLER